MDREASGAIERDTSGAQVLAKIYFTSVKELAPGAEVDQNRGDYLGRGVMAESV
jgi:hypothetical protein